MRVSKAINSRITSLRNPTYSGGSSSIDRVSRIKGVGSPSDKSLNFEYDKENFYESLKRNQNRKKEYEDGKNSDDSSYSFSEEEMELIKTLQNVITNFNKKIDYIKNIDRARNTNVFEKIKSVINSYTRFLNEIGISVDVRAYHFSINPENFAREIMRNPHKLNKLLDPINGILRKITDAITV